MKVLWATDGSAGAGAAGGFLRLFGWRGGDQLTVVTVVPHYLRLTGRIDPSGKPAGTGSDEEVRAAGEIVSQAAESMRAVFGAVETRVYAGSPAQEILAAAREARPDLVVVGSRGHSALQEWLLGSVAKTVLESAACSVLIARPATGPLARVLLAYDGSPQAEAALQLACRLPFPHGARVDVVGVVPPAQLPPTPIDLPIPAEYYEVAVELTEHHTELTRRLLDRAVSQLRQADRPADGQCRLGAPAPELAAVVKEKGIDLVLMGAHARQGWIPDLLGNTTRGVVQATNCSVLVARDGAGPANQG